MKPESVSRVLAMWGALMGLGAGAWAEAAPPSPQARAALETLFASEVGGAVVGVPGVQAAALAGSGPAAGAAGAGAGAAMGTTTAPAGRTTVAVARGQALDTLIRQHLGTSPLRIEVLRDLIRQLNPQAFAPGGGHRLLAGAHVQLPTRDDQIRAAFGPHAVVQPPATEAAAGYNAAAAARRSWVRYP